MPPDRSLQSDRGLHDDVLVATLPDGPAFLLPGSTRLVKLSIWMECIHILDSNDALLKPGLNLLLAVDALMTECSLRAAALAAGGR